MQKTMKELLNSRAVREWLAVGWPQPAIIQHIDLTSFAQELAATDLTGCVLLGCKFDDTLRQQLLRQNVHVVPDVGALPLPFVCFPTKLYDAASLYHGFDPAKVDSWQHTPDHKGWAFFMSQDGVTPNSLDIAQSASTRLHDTAIEHAAARFLTHHHKPAIAFMGGHDVHSDASDYRQVVQLARDLRRKGYMVVTGGGPGLMEAANLGAFLSTQPDDAIEPALAALPAKHFKSHEWLSTAAAVRAKFNGNWNAPIEGEQTSLAMPTWRYGHEPPNLFASHIAKLFNNSLREDGLVTVASGGIIFGPGSAGTVQEVFQDLTQNYYRGAMSPTPMVFLNPAYWIRASDDLAALSPHMKPNQSLLALVRQLAAEKDFLSEILASDDIVEIAQFLDRAPSKPKSARRIADVRIASRSNDEPAAP